MGNNRSAQRTDKCVSTVLGGVAWISSVQYFFVQWWVASRWPRPYQFSSNFISDLGNTTCGNVGGSLARYVCSPEHHWMNSSFTLLGLTTALGAVLLRRRVMPGRLGLLSTALFVTSGLGMVMVGQNPENLSIGRHILGAYLNAYGACLAILLMGYATRQKTSLTPFSNLAIATGALLLTLDIIEVLGVNSQIAALSLWLGKGGIEKLTNYLTTTWLMASGAYFLRPALNAPCHGIHDTHDAC